MSVLIFLSALLLATTAMAEPAGSDKVDSKPRYYTWVDAQGMMHNTLIAPDEDSAAKPSFDAGEFPSEEEYQNTLDDHSAEKKPFFTWTDAEGVIRSEVKPNVLVDFIAEEIIYDAVFAPPFRLPSYIKQGQCCEAYAKAFTVVAEFNGSASYLVDDTVFPFKTQSGNVAAGYFSLPELAAKEIVLLKSYKLPSDSTFEVVALDGEFQPLYLASKLKGLFIEQTWKDLAYKKILLEISDTEIKYLVVFVRPKESLLVSNAAKQGVIKKNTLSDYRLSVMRDQLLD